MGAIAIVRPQTLGEEVANAISHGLGLLLAIASLPILVWQAGRQGTPADVVAVSVFAGTMILLYLVSTLYHALPASRAKAWFNRFDHAAIYLFIAGSYTPFTFGVLRGAWGLTLSGVVWAIAAVGASVKLANRLNHPLWSTAMYVALGWIALVAVAPLAQRMPGSGLAWLAVGGLSYTVGAIVFLFDHRLRYLHFVWHLFVIGGSSCHFCAVLWYARG
jgi:hemolysin III